jgi:hypothetical protein
VEKLVGRRGKFTAVIPMDIAVIVKAGVSVGDATKCRDYGITIKSL